MQTPSRKKAAFLHIVHSLASVLHRWQLLALPTHAGTTVVLVFVVVVVVVAAASVVGTVAAFVVVKTSTNGAQSLTSVP